MTFVSPASSIAGAAGPPTSGRAILLLGSPMQLIGRVWASATSPTRANILPTQESDSEDSAGGSGSGESSVRHSPAGSSSGSSGARGHSGDAAVAEESSYGFIDGDGADGRFTISVSSEDATGMPNPVLRRSPQVRGSAFRRELTRHVAMDPQEIRRTELEDLSALICRRELLDAEILERRNKLRVRSTRAARVDNGAGEGGDSSLDARSPVPRWRRRLTSRISSVVTKLKWIADAKEGHSFRNHFQEELLKERVRCDCVFGAKILLSIICLIFGFRCIVIVVQALTGCSGKRDEQDSEGLVAAVGLGDEPGGILGGEIHHAIGCVSIICLLVVVIKWCERPWFYYLLVMGASVYVAGSGFRFGKGCSDLATLITTVCDATSTEDPRLRHCASGVAFVGMISTWILLSAFFIPTSRGVHFNWVGIWCVFLLPLITWVQNDEPISETSKFDLYSITLYMCGINFVALMRKWSLEERDQHSLVLELRQFELSWRMFLLLDYMVPGFVILPMLMEPGGIVAKRIECATVLFVVISDFDSITQKMPPQKLLDFLNRHFIDFDNICERFKVTKIETVREEYVCAVGVAPEHIEETLRDGPSGLIGNLIRAVVQILSLQQDLGETDPCTSRQRPAKYLQCGMHTGPLFAGVSGHKLPRFRLIGDTMNTAARMMQKGRPGELQFGQATHALLPEWVTTKSLGTIEMKGKGEVEVFALDLESISPSASGAESSRRSRHSPSAEGSDRRHRDRSPPVATSRSRILSSSRSRFLSSSSSLPATRSRLPSSSSSSIEAELGMVSCEGSEPLADLHRFQEILAQCKAHINRIADDGADGNSAPFLPFSWTATSKTSRSKADPVLDASYRAITRDHFDCTMHSNTGLKRRTSSRSAESREAVCWKADFEEWYIGEHQHQSLKQRLQLSFAALVALTVVESTILLIGFKGSSSEIDDDYLEISPGSLTTYWIMRGLATALWGAGCRFHIQHQSWWYENPVAAHRSLLVLGVIIATVLICSAWTLPLEQRPTFSSYGHLPVPQLTPVSFVRLVEGMVFVVAVFTGAMFLRHALLLVLLGFILSGLSFQRFLQENKRSEHTAGELAGEIATRFIFNIAMILHAYAVRVVEHKEQRQFIAQRATEVSQSRMFGILNTLMPPLVVEELRRNPPTAALPCHRYHRATLVQADLVGFTAMCNGLQPSEVVALISDIFGLFDQLTDVYEVYKIETVGDAYIAGQAETPLTRRNSPLEVAKFALDMIRRVHEWSTSHEQVVNCRVGIHTGECVGGIVGCNMQRYHLFGKMMSEAEILESTAPAGYVQASSAFWDAVEPELDDKKAQGLLEPLLLEPRNLEVLYTSKGESHLVTEVGGPTYLLRGYEVDGRGW